MAASRLAASRLASPPPWSRGRFSSPRAMADAPAAALESSPKYKELCRHVAEVLDSFVKCRDWPDFIHSIETLKNVFQKHPEFSVVPHKTTIAKRLAQGCTSATDAVHTKSLELYELIFKRVGEQQLAADLALYTLGIFPLFRHGATAARLKILDIAGRYFVPLGPQLIPCLSGLLPALLPALDAAGDTAAQPDDPVYPAVVDLLGVTETRISAPHFYRALWHSIMSLPRVRLGGLHLFERARGFTEYVEGLPVAQQRGGFRNCACLPDPSRLVIKSLCSCLEDDRVPVKMAAATLVRRGFPLGLCPVIFRGGGETDEPAAVAAADDSCTVRLVQTMLLLLNGEDGVDRKVVIDWLVARRGRESEQDAARCRSTILTALQGLLLERPRSRAAATWPYTVLRALLSHDGFGWLGTSIAASLVRSVTVGDPVHDVVSIRDRRVAARGAVEQLGCGAVWQALEDTAQPVVSDESDAGRCDRAADISLMEEVVDFLPMDDPATQDVHLPRFFFRVVSHFREQIALKRLSSLHRLLQLCRKTLDHLKTAENGQLPAEISSLLQQAVAECHDIFALMVSTLVPANRMWQRFQPAHEQSSSAQPHDECSAMPRLLVDVVAVACRLQLALLRKGYASPGKSATRRGNAATKRFPSYALEAAWTVSLRCASNGCRFRGPCHSIQLG